MTRRAGALPRDRLPRPRPAWHTVSVPRVLVLVLALAGACTHSGASSRTLHYVGKDLVSTPQVDHRAYAAYLQARLALETAPPDLPRALEQIDLALRYDRDDPHLWTTRGEIELRMGDVDAARDSSRRALSYNPDYPPARQLAARVQTPGTPQVADRR